MKNITWINGFLGFWLLFSPMTLGISSRVVFWEDIVAGSLIAGFAFLQAIESDEKAVSGYTYSIGVFGVWILFAPFLFGYAGIAVALWNEVIVGTVVVLLAFYQGILNTATLPTHQGPHPSH